MNHFGNRPYEHNRRLILLVGLCPYEDSSIRRRRISIVSVILWIGIITQTYLLITSERKMQPIVDLLTTFLPTICFSACYYNILFHFDGVKNILDRMDADYDNLANEQEWYAMKKYVDQNKVYSMMIAGVFYFNIGFICSPTFYHFYLHGFGVNNDNEFVLPIRFEYCVHNKSRYFTMLSMQVVGMLTVCTVGVAYYTMVISCLQHACALFTIVTVKIDQSLRKRDNDSTSSVSRGEHGRFLSVIKSYNSAIDFVNLLIVVCTKMYFFEVILALLLLIIDFLHLFRLLDMILTKNEAIKSIMFITGTIFLICSAFYMGQRLIDHSFNVYEQCCQIPFYALSIKTQKLLVMLIIRSLKPCSINVSGMMVTSHEVLAKIANVSYSFAIVCYRMR